MGDAGILLLQWKLAPSEAVAAQLAEAIRANEENPTRELMWGAPGTMLAALAMQGWTQQPRWAELFRRSAARLWSALERVAARDCLLWSQDLYGSRSRFLGAVHGFAGNVLPVIRGRTLLAAQVWRDWSECIRRTIAATALREGAHINWPLSLVEPSTPRAALLVQHCHGAPGVVSCLAEDSDPSLDELLVAAGELVFAAGPLRKGSNLCHGTAGNGFAFLKLFRRTGDERWLERARAFAMHAIAQWRWHTAEFGRGRPSLWTGDPGLAIYLWSCIQGTDGFPTLDFF